MGVPYPDFATYEAGRRLAFSAQMQNAASTYIASPDAFGIELAIKTIAEAGDEKVKDVLRQMRQEAFEREEWKWKGHPMRSLVRAWFGDFPIMGMFMSIPMTLILPFLIVWECCVVALEGSASEINK